MGKYRIKTVAQLTGIRKVTLQAWERRYNVLTPKRNASGYRLYSEADVQKLLALKQLIDNGHAISEAIKLLQANTCPPQINDLQQVGSSLLQALISFDRPTALDIIASLQLLPNRVLIHELYFPLLMDLDTGISAGKFSIVQEHFTSGFVRDQLVSMFLTCNKIHSENKVVAACLPEELHDIGLLALAIELTEKHYQVIFLGARVPLNDLILCCQQQQPTIICLSYSSTDSFDVVEYLSTLRNSIPLSIPIYIGGNKKLDIDIAGIHQTSPLQREL